MILLIGSKKHDFSLDNKKFDLEEDIIEVTYDWYMKSENVIGYPTNEKRKKLIGLSLYQAFNNGLIGSSFEVIKSQKLMQDSQKTGSAIIFYRFNKPLFFIEISKAISDQLGKLKGDNHISFPSNLFFENVNRNYPDKAIRIVLDYDLDYYSWLSECERDETRYLENEVWRGNDDLDISEQNWEEDSPW